MVVEANYGGARSEGSWMDTWGVRIWPSHGERKEICWRLSILFLPPLHMHSLYLFIYLFILSRLFSKQLHTFQLNPLLQYSWR
jgi:hypothetical protein